MFTDHFTKFEIFQQLEAFLNLNIIVVNKYVFAANASRAKRLR